MLRAMTTTEPLSGVDSYALVDLGALGRNLIALRRHVGGRSVLLPVKANAYGHGLVPIAQAALDNGWADWLGVATVSEGIALRRAGLRAPILKLSGAAPEQVADAVAHDLRLTIGDAPSAREAEAAAAAQHRTAAVHLKIDTGMRRIGVEPASAADLAELVERQPHLELEGVFTHLAVSDTPAQDAFTTRQLALFDEAVAAIEHRLGRRPRLVHAANSGATLGHPAAWGDLVRPGIASYGYYPDPSTPRTVALEPVLSLKSRLSFVKTVLAGETVSYGRTWTAPTATRIGTVPIGYGDGYSRVLSNRADVLVAGRRQPVVGRVCMDQLMVDLGPDSPLTTGDTVTLIGRDGDQAIGADWLGELWGTISYEVLCAIAARIPRLYNAPMELPEG
jgi:alanine racemase